MGHVLPDVRRPGQQAPVELLLLKLNPPVSQQVIHFQWLNNGRGHATCLLTVLDMSLLTSSCFATMRHVHLERWSVNFKSIFRVHESGYHP
jgi:hypothetical protein